MFRTSEAVPNLSHVTISQKCNVAHTQELFTIFKVTATNGEILFYHLTGIMKLP